MEWRLSVLSYNTISVTELQPGERVMNACKHHSAIRVVQVTCESQGNDPQARRGTVHKRDSFAVPGWSVCLLCLFVRYHILRAGQVFPTVGQVLKAW